MNRFVLILVSFPALVVSGCGPGAAVSAVDSVAAKGKAENVADDYFRLAAEQDWAAIEALYHPRFFEAMPLETWLKILPNVEAELGPVVECSQQNWNVAKQVSTDFTGTVANLVYTCEHEKYDSTVSFTIVKPTGESEYRIIGQNFNSIGFLIE